LIDNCAIENQWHSWSLLTGLTGPKAAAAQVALLNSGSAIKGRLGLRADPFRFRGTANGIEFQASGIAGSLSLREVSLEIVPKFVLGPDQLAAWNTSTLFFLEALASKHVIALIAENQRWSSHSVVDLIAHAFADAADRGFRDQVIHIYRQNEVAGSVLRGRLNIRRQVRNMIHAPHMLECDVDELDIENPFNDVLKWAATVLQNLARHPELKIRLAEIARAIPGVAERSVAQRHHRLRPPPQYRSWADALELARLVASGMALSSNGGRTGGYSLLFNMERAFERFVEVALERVVQEFGNGQLSSTRQQSTAYAQPASTDGKMLYCRPDNVLMADGSAVMVVDAKYKLLDGDVASSEGERGAPISQDVYELVAGMFANGCCAGLLVYPSSTLTGTRSPKVRTWSLNLYGTTVRVGALPVDLLSLRSRADLAAQVRLVGTKMATFMDGAVVVGGERSVQEPATIFTA
jgi:5-methylcytosine-specific restriction enzyme subunit McrC